MLFQKKFLQLSVASMAVLLSIFTTGVPVKAEETLLNQNDRDGVNVEYTVAQYRRGRPRRSARWGRMRKLRRQRARYWRLSRRWQREHRFRYRTCVRRGGRRCQRILRRRNPYRRSIRRLTRQIRRLEGGYYYY